MNPESANQESRVLQILDDIERVKSDEFTQDSFSEMMKSVECYLADTEENEDSDNNECTNSEGRVASNEAVQAYLESAADDAVEAYFGAIDAEKRENESPSQSEPELQMMDTHPKALLEQETTDRPVTKAGRNQEVLRIRPPLTEGGTLQRKPPTNSARDDVASQSTAISDTPSVTPVPSEDEHEEEDSDEELGSKRSTLSPPAGEAPPAKKKKVDFAPSVASRQEAPSTVLSPLVASTSVMSRVAARTGSIVPHPTVPPPLLPLRPEVSAPVLVPAAALSSHARSVASPPVPIPSFTAARQPDAQQSAAAPSSQPRPIFLRDDLRAFRDEDVLFGRGGLSNHHAGNKRYREEVDRLKPLYQAKNLTKKEKTNLRDQLVDTVRGYGGRFLKYNAEGGGRWEEVPLSQARKKASQALREDRKKGASR